MSVPPAQVQLVSYIAPSAPATRRPARGDEPRIRAEIGFTPAWYRESLAIDFGQSFHLEPAYRRQCVIQMRAELRRRFPGTAIGGIDRPDAPLDLLTGLFGAGTVAAIYGVPLVYGANSWPDTAHQFLDDALLARLEPPDLDRNPHFAQLVQQVEWIARHEGPVEGFINWQGALNNAFRLRGQQIYVDLLDEPEKAEHLLTCITATMQDGITRLHHLQRTSGVDVPFVTVSNCLVNMVSPRVYREQLLKFDQQLAGLYGLIGIHNCAWSATPYLEAYADIPGVGYIDMGIGSDQVKARALFPNARRAIMVTPMDLANKPLAAIETDLQRIARDFAPCDLVLADIEAGTPDRRVCDILDLCRHLSEA